MNRHSKHILCLFTTFALATSLICSISAETTQESCATVSIAAGTTDFPKLALDLTLYQRDKTNTFTQLKEMELTTTVNRVSKDVEIHITPRTEGVSVRVDYLTDLNGDNCYELLDSEAIPAYDMVTSSGTLSSASDEESFQLSAETPYTLTADELIARGNQAFQDRTQEQNPHYIPNLEHHQSDDYALIYMITISSEGQEDLCYYLQIFDQVPSVVASEFLDVKSDAWYYQAIDYVTANNLISAISSTEFAPTQPTTRKMLAQTLYCVAGKPKVSPLYFEDITSLADLDAISWLVTSNLISSLDTTYFRPEDTITRQEFAFALYQFAQTQGIDTQNSESLNTYQDSTFVASWAKPAVQWTISTGLLSGQGTNQSKIEPNKPLTRADFASAIYILHSSILEKS